MRDIDERVAAVQRCTRNMKRRRDRSTKGALATLIAFAFVGLMGLPVVNGQATAAFDGASLFGASSLFGPSAGGYVIVALITAVVVALVTALCVTRRRSGEEERGAPEARTGFADDVDSLGR